MIHINKIVENPSDNYLYKGDTVFKTNVFNMSLLLRNEHFHQSECLMLVPKLSTKTELSAFKSDLLLKRKIFRNKCSPCILLQNKKCELNFHFYPIFFNITELFHFLTNQMSNTTGNIINKKLR